MEITSGKRAIFDRFARESNAADIPDAVDISESDLAQQIIEQERMRLGLDDTLEVEEKKEAPLTDLP